MSETEAPQDPAAPAEDPNVTESEDESTEDEDSEEDDGEPETTE